MSFNNDDDSDGLAALFGGITPQTGADAAPGPRRSAPAPQQTPAASPPQAAAPQGTAVPPAASAPYPAAPSPHYPGLAEQTPPNPPAPTPASPAYQMPAPGAAYDLPAPASAPASPYDLPAPASAAAAPPPAFPSPPPAAAAPPPYLPPAPTAAPPFDSPAPVVPPSYDAPAPAAPQYPGPPPHQPSAYPAYQPPAAPEWPGALPPQQTAFPAAAPVSTPPPASAEAVSAPPAYPPTAQYPTGLEPAAYGVPAVVPEPTPPADLPAPVAAPPPVVEPPAPDPFNGFAALGLEDTPAPVAPSGPFGAPPASAEGPAAAYDLPSPVFSPRPGEAAPPLDHQLVAADAAPLATTFPPGPLLPSAGRPIDIPDHLERSTVGERIGLALAVVGGPIGLVLAIVNAIRGSRRRGWLIGTVRASLVLGVLSTIVVGIAGYALWNLRLAQLEHDEVAAASAEFCAAGQADPSLVTAPTLGWPSPGSTITDSLELMQAWTDNWTALAATAPDGLRAGMELLAARGQTIVDAVTASRYVDDESNIAQISSVQAQSGIASWYATYCAQP